LPLGGEAYCAHCGYQLTGLPQRGACPECGQEYDPGSIVGRDSPTTLNIIIRFGWPVALYALSTLLLFAHDLLGDSGMVLLFLAAVIGAAGCFINVPVQIWLLRRSGATRAGKRGERIMTLMTCMSAVSIIGPFVIFGGCLCVVTSS